MRFTFDPNKDAAHIAKHGLSLADAPTVAAPRWWWWVVAGLVLVLVYVLRELDEVRAISLRRASKQERKLYANHQEAQ